MCTTSIHDREDLNRQPLKCASCPVSLRPTHHGRFLRDIVADLSIIQPQQECQDQNARMKVRAMIDRDNAATIDGYGEGEEATGPKEPREKVSPTHVATGRPLRKFIRGVLGSTTDLK